MSFLETAAKRIRNIFEGDNDELLFFVVVFLTLMGNSTYDSRFVESEEKDSSQILFFIALFFILMSSNDFLPLPRVATEAV